MKTKIILISLIFAFLLIETVSAITEINPDAVNPGDTISLTIRPNKKYGFYNIIYIMKEQEVVDLINVPCETVCKKRMTVDYIVSLDFSGEYYFATFDYEIDDYELDYFTVIEQGGAPSGTLAILDIKNSDSTTSFLISPEQGKRANITISTSLKTKDCQNYQVRAYLCNETLYSGCSSENYTYSILLQFTEIQGGKCFFDYIGEDYFPFYEQGGAWKIITKSGFTSDERDFTYSSLKAVNYASYINFGSLNSNMWNMGVPQSGENLTNYGNVELMIDWNCSGFSCISADCTDYWATFYQGENNFQIDDDNIFMEETETGLLPVFITDYSINYFPQSPIPTCISDYCNNSMGEKIPTYYNLKIYDIERGVYQGDIILTLS